MKTNEEKWNKYFVCVINVLVQLKFHRIEKWNSFKVKKWFLNTKNWAFLFILHVLEWQRWNPFNFCSEQLCLCMHKSFIDSAWECTIAFYSIILQFLFLLLLLFIFCCFCTKKKSHTNNVYTIWSPYWSSLTSNDRSHLRVLRILDSLTHIFNRKNDRMNERTRVAF